MILSSESSPSLSAYRVLATAVLLWASFFSSSLVLAETAGASPPSVEPAWGDFRGSGRTGVSPATGLARTWPEEGPPVRWRRPIGGGYSGVAMDQDGLFTMFSEEGISYLGRFRSEDGKEVWRLEMGPSFEDEFGIGPRTTPVLVGERVVALSARGLLAVARRDIGALEWRFDLYSEHGFHSPQWGFSGPTEPGLQLPIWGYSATPLVVEGQVILDTGHGEGESILALDLATGEKRWGALDTPVGYASPLLIEAQGRSQIVVLTPQEIVSLLPDGEVFWRHPWPITFSQPVFLPPDRLFLSTVDQEVTTQVFHLALEAEQPLIKPGWGNRQMRNFWNSSIAHGDTIYGFDNATFKSLDATGGDLNWAKRRLGKGSLLVADDLLFIYSDQGLLVLAEAKAEAFQEGGRMKVFEASRTWTPPSLFDGLLVVRGAGELVGLEVGAAKAEEVGR